MDDTHRSPDFRPNSNVINGKKMSKICLIAAGPKSFSHKSLKAIASLNPGKKGRRTAGQVALFLLKVAALETVRRFSRVRCPYVWSGLQAMQILSYPPLNWIQRWYPFKGLIKGMQMLSRPLLFLSVTTAFSDQSGCCDVASDDVGNSDSPSDSHTVSVSHSEPPYTEPTPDTRIQDEAPQFLSSTNWLLQLHAELESQGITIPERINEDELQRFYTAANGDFSCFLSSVKKTIRWREVYQIFSREELEMWSTMVFWHGFDVYHRPCLLVRLGVACTRLPSHDRPRFIQAVVSQVEHGILHLIDNKNPQITVLVDCEGLSPLRFPLQMMRSCSTILQDNFPNRLGCLFAIRLPPLVRVTAQTFIQVLKPTTRQKLKFVGEMDQKVVSEYLQTLPSYLGGTCTCTKCANVSIYNRQQPRINEETRETHTTDINNGENFSSFYLNHQTEMHTNGGCDHVVRTAMVGILIFWVLIAFIAGIFDPSSRPILPP